MSELRQGQTHTRSWRAQRVGIEGNPPQDGWEAREDQRGARTTTIEFNVERRDRDASARKQGIE